MDPLPEPTVRILLSEIDWDDRAFEIRRLAPTTGLVESLARCGILSPPWVLRGNSGRLIIVDGFKRFDWLKDSRAEAASCIVISGQVSLESLWLRRLTMKVFGPSLNVAEKAQIAARILDFIPDEADKRRLLSSLGIVPRDAFPGRWRDLGTGSPLLLRAAAAGDICERAALELASWRDESGARDALIEILGQLRCSASIQMEIVERVSEIALAGDTSRLLVIRMPEIASIAAHPDWNRREKTQALRDLLTRLRYPRLRAREASFQKNLADLSLPKAICISPPPSFEGDVYRLQVDFSSPEELRGHGDAIRSLASDPRLSSLMRPARPDRG